MLIVAAFQIVVLGIMFDECLGCSRGGTDSPIFGWGYYGRSLQDIDKKMIPREETHEVHWTFGVCSQEQQACQDKRYDMYNVTEISGAPLASLFPVPPALGFIEGLKFPDGAQSMNCEEICNCLSCGHGVCSNTDDQSNCPGNSSGFICGCSKNEGLPVVDILADMKKTGNVCRQC